MNTNDLDRSLNAWFDAVEPRSVPTQVLPSVFAVTQRIGQRRALGTRIAAAMHVGRLEDSAAQRTPRLMLAVAAAGAVFIGAMGIALLAPGMLIDRSGAVTRDQTPSPTPTSLPTTEQDWPLPLRSEPDGPPMTVPMEWEPGTKHIWIKPAGAGQPDIDWLEIAEVRLSDQADVSFVDLELAGALPRSAVDQDVRVAYGLVLETTGDGVADYRLGIENAAAGRFRLWVTDLHSGNTRAGVFGGDLGSVRLGDGYAFGDALHPAEVDSRDSWAQLIIQWSSVLGRQPAARETILFYTWSSAIFPDGAVVGDHAPAAGWFELELASGIVPDEQMTTIHQLADAVNSADADALLSVFDADGVEGFDALGVFDDESPRSTMPIGELSSMSAWATLVDVWGLEVEVLDCEGSEWSAECTVTTRWHTLAMEVTQSWRLEFQGRQLVHWEASAGNLNPTQRDLPLGHVGLKDWERWLETNHPEAAARYLAPGWEGYLVEGVRFRLANSLIPYDPSLAPEIRASIQEYLAD